MLPLELFELLKHDLRVVSVPTLRTTGELAAEAVKVASSNNMSGMQTLSNLGRLSRLRPAEAAASFIRVLEGGGLRRPKLLPALRVFVKTARRIGRGRIGTSRSKLLPLLLCAEERPLKDDSLRLMMIGIGIDSAEEEADRGWSAVG